MMKPGLYFFSILFIYFSVACKSSKKTNADKANTFMSKRYHDLVARDNSYFNAKMKMRSAKQKLYTASVDDYSRVLDLNKYGSAAESGAISGDMEEVVKKTSFVVQIHPNSKWVDDSYLLMGQAFFLKKDYNSAMGTFQYIAAELKGKRPSDKAKVDKEIEKKKQAERKEALKTYGKIPKKNYSKNKATSPSVGSLMKEEKNKTTAKLDDQNIQTQKKSWFQEEILSFGFIKHKPVRYDAMVWIIDAYLGQKKYSEAELLIQMLEKDKDFPSRLDGVFSLRKADLFLKQEDYKKAIQPLENAIGLTKMKKRRARYSFILAQCYEMNADNGNALSNYKKVLHFNPEYEMEFNTKLKIARTAASGNAESRAEAKQILKQMLKDAKNEEYFDQIYYALAELGLLEKKEDESVQYLTLATQKSVNNNKQKALAFLKLAEIYFEREKYPASKNYYDSTLTILNKEYPDYSSIADRREVLKDAVSRILIIEREDSLQRIAKMSDLERTRFLNDLVKKMREQEERQADSAANAQIIVGQQTAISNQQNTIGSFYFYNANAKAKGYQDFIKKWGARTNEDNWRRKNKQSFSSGGTFVSGTSEESTSKKGKISKDEMLKDIPITLEQQKISNEKLIDAMYDLGNIYRERMKNDKKAIDVFEDLERRFPDNKYAVQVYFNLYLLYAKGNPSKAENCRNIILTQYSKSSVAKTIQDPDFVSESQQKKFQLNDFYSRTYQLYLNSKFNEVVINKSIADLKFENNELQSKFDLLEALCIGKLKDTESFKKALQEVSRKYKGKEEGKKADEILQAMDKK